MADIFGNLRVTIPFSVGVCKLFPIEDGVIWLTVALKTAVSSALPTIVHDLQGNDFIWVASAYALASTALLPTTGGMAEVSTDQR